MNNWRVEDVKDTQGFNQCIFRGDELVMKRWVDHDGNPRQPTRVFNRHWPDVEVVSKETHLMTLINHKENVDGPHTRDEGEPGEHDPDRYKFAEQDLDEWSKRNLNA